MWQSTPVAGKRRGKCCRQTLGASCTTSRGLGAAEAPVRWVGFGAGEPFENSLLAVPLRAAAAAVPPLASDSWMLGGS